MEVQTVQTSPVPPVITGSPAPTIEVQPTTMAEELAKFQASRTAKLAPKDDRPPFDPAAIAAAEADAAAANAKAAQAQAPAPAPTPTRTFTEEEVQAMLREKEQQIFTRTQQAPAPQVSAPAPAQQQTSKEDEELEVLMYSDPKEYTRRVKEMSVREMRAQQQHEENQKKIVQEFYNKYPDLKGKEDLVELHAVKMAPALANTNPEDARSKLAQAVRSRIESLRGEKVATEALSSKPAVTAGAVGGQSGSAPAPKGPEGLSFVEQLKLAQRKGKTRY